MPPEHSRPAMRRSIVFATDALEPVIELAQQAEKAGFDRVWTTEYQHRDAVIRALAIALRTESIEVGTGVAYAFARLPLAMAAMSADVQRLSGGRFGLGITAGTRGVRRWFGADFDPPAPALVSYVNSLREAWTHNADLPSPPPVFAAALNPIMGKHAAANFDGVLLHPLALGRTHLRERLLPALAHGSTSSGRSPQMIAWCIASVDADEDRARERARAQLAFYFSTPSYRTVAEGTHWEHIPPAVQEAFRAADSQSQWKQLGAVIPDAVVDELTLAGTPASVARRAADLERELAGLGIAEVAFAVAGADVAAAEFTASCEQIVHALAPSH